MPTTLDDETVESLFDECIYTPPVRHRRAKAYEANKSIRVPVKTFPIGDGFVVFNTTALANRAEEINRLFIAIAGSLSSRPQGVELGNLVLWPNGTRWTQKTPVAEKLMALLIAVRKVELVKGAKFWPINKDEPPRYRLR